MKQDRSRKFYRPWTGPFKIMRKFSELNYEIIDLKDKKKVVHINRLKSDNNPELWKPKTKQKPQKKLHVNPTDGTDEPEDSVWKPKSLSLAYADDTVNNRECEPPADQSPIHPTIDTPNTDNQDPTYHPSDSLRSRRELQSTRTEPPVTRSRTRILSQADIV